MKHDDKRCPLCRSILPEREINEEVSDETVWIDTRAAVWLTKHRMLKEVIERDPVTYNRNVWWRY